MTSVTTPLLTEAHKRQYREEGYFIPQRVIPDPMLRMLREECAGSITRRVIKGAETD